MDIAARGSMAITPLDCESVEILATDGRPLFSIELKSDGGLEVRTGGLCPARSQFCHR